MIKMDVSNFDSLYPIERTGEAYIFLTKNKLEKKGFRYEPFEIHTEKWVSI